MGLLICATLPASDGRKGGIWALSRGALSFINRSGRNRKAVVVCKLVGKGRQENVVASLKYIGFRVFLQSLFEGMKTH